MKQNTARIGNFTSSNIHKLITSDKKGTGLGAPALNYIAQKNLERRLNRSIETSASTNAMNWGIFLEQRVLDLLSFEYELTSKETDIHPEINYWAGSKDLIVRGVKVADIKCFQLENFALFTDCILSQDTEKLKSEFPKEYWQLISNAIINGTPNAEAVSYCPYYSELQEIQEMAMDYADLDLWKYRFIYESKFEDLPNLSDDGYYKNLNRFEFELPKEDVELLTERVKKAGEMLIPFYTLETISANK